MEDHKKMKKTTIITTALLLIAVLILSGCKSGATGGAVVCSKPYLLVGNDCCLDKNDNQVCDKDEVTEELKPEPVDVVEEPTKELPAEEPKIGAPKELPAEEYTITLGDSIQFEGKTVTLVGVENTPLPIKGIYNIDGVEREVYGTKNMGLISGIKVTNIKYLNLEKGFIVKLEKLVLKDNEYLMNTRENAIIQGKTFKLYDVTESEDVRKIILHITGTGIETGKLILQEGETETFAGLKISNLYSFPSGFKNERQALIKVE